MKPLEPVAWRVECRWVDQSKGGGWRKYADYGTLKAAETAQVVFANPGDIESRIVPLVRAEDAINAIEEQSMVAVKLACAIDHIREALNGGNVEDLMYVINTALAEYHKKVPA